MVGEYVGFIDSIICLSEIQYVKFIHRNVIIKLKDGEKFEYSSFEFDELQDASAILKEALLNYRRCL